MIALPSRSLTEAISPTSTPAMLTVWPWPGRDRLRGRHLGLDLEELLAHDRHPAGQRQPLLAEDHGRHRGRDDQQPDDRQEVQQVLADRRPHLALRRVFLAVPNGLSFLRTAPRSASRRSLSRTDLTWAVSVGEPLGERLGRGGPVDVRDLLLVAGLVGLVRRLLARIGGTVAERHLDVVAEQLAGARARLAERHGLRAAAGLEAHVHAVAVEVLALARDPDQRVEELLVVLLAGRELVVDDDVARGQDDVAQAAWTRGRSAAAARSRGRSAARGRSSPARAPWPGRRARPGRPARGSARSTGTRPRSSPASRARPGGCRARTGAWAGTPR